jgi:hypothetical protein
MGQPWVFRALGDPNRRLVEDNINAFHGFPHGLRVPNVTFHQSHATARHRRLEILMPAASEVVQHDDFLAPIRDQTIGYM